MWLTLSSVVLAFVFVFGNNIRNLYESVIFLFIVHPFDVGDCLLIAEAWHTVSCHRILGAVCGITLSWQPHAIPKQADIRYKPQVAALCAAGVIRPTSPMQADC